jgi:hypothetical protein
MLQSRMFWVVASAVLGLLQAWDSGALQAGASAQALIAAGLAAPVLSIAAGLDQRTRIAALLTGAALLVWARMIAPVSLNTLHLALFVPAIYILFVSGLASRIVPDGGRRA